MNIKYINTIIFVENIEISKKFYNQVLNQKIINDYGPYIVFENNFAIHEAKSFFDNLYNKNDSNHNKSQGMENLLINFQCKNLESIFKKVEESKAKIIHPIKTQSWGQKVFRFCDPDGHIVEIGEPH